MERHEKLLFSMCDNAMFTLACKLSIDCICTSMKFRFEQYGHHTEHKCLNEYMANSGYSAWNR